MPLLLGIKFSLYPYVQHVCPEFGFCSLKFPLGKSFDTWPGTVKGRPSSISDFATFSFTELTPCLFKLEEEGASMVYRHIPFFLLFVDTFCFTLT
jgi:hypothetical protein